jgi:hypothetical protein
MPIQPGVAVADPKRQSRRQRQIAPAAVRANTRISVRVGLIQILDHYVLERLGLRLLRRHAAHTLHDDALVLEPSAPARGRTGVGREPFP